MKCFTCGNEHDGGKGSRGTICVECVRKRDAKYREKLKDRKKDQAKQRTEKKKEEIKNNPDEPKTCFKCSKIKTIRDFREFKNQCKECENEYARKYNEKHPGRMEEYYKKNKERLSKKNLENYKKNKQLKETKFQESIIIRYIKINGEEIEVEQQIKGGRLDVRKITELCKKKVGSWKNTLKYRKGSEKKPNMTMIEEITKTPSDEWLIERDNRTWLHINLFKFYSDWCNPSLGNILEEWRKDWILKYEPKKIEVGSKTNSEIERDNNEGESKDEEKKIEKIEQEPNVEDKGNELAIANGSLNINNIQILCRTSDGKINATQLCQAGNKKINDWFRLKTTTEFMKELSMSLGNNLPNDTQEFLNELKSSTGIPVDDLIIYESGANENRATWVHPQVAINIAQWISPKFNVQVTKWIFELATTGQVILGKEKSQEDIELKWKTRLEETKQKLIESEKKNKELISINRRITGNLNQLRKLHHYVRFNIEGACYYIYSVPNPDNPTKHIKIRAGIAGTKGNERLDKRLQDHRSDDSNMHLELIITSSSLNIILLEKMIKQIHKETMIAPNHELWSDKQDIGEFMESAKDTISLICKKNENGFDILPQNKINEYNQDLEKTLIK